MEQNIGFNIFEQQPTNEDIQIIFNPDPLYQSYKVTINKDEQIYKEFTKINSVPTEFTLSETGKYQINITYYDEYYNQTQITSGTYIIDKEAPILKIGKEYKEINLGKKLNIMEDVIASDNYDGNLTSKVITNEKEINFKEKGIKKINYIVQDQAGNITEQQKVIKITHSDTTIFIFQLFFIAMASLVVIGTVIYNKSIRLEKRISRFSITPLKDNTLSLFDKISIKISELLNTMNNILYKSEFLKKYSKRYTKYIRMINYNNRTSMDFVSIKIICSFICIITAIFAKTVQLKVFEIYDAYIPMIFGFFIPDIVYYFKYKTYRKKLENDLLQAIIIMNNAFKSGRSITQAIDLVSKELDGPMAEEYKKMHLELSFGLGMDVVFKRLYERIKIEEIAYLTASLTILNQTGGNIVQVFSSIEKSLFNKKKLRLELKSLTSGSRMIVGVLTIVPIAFILLIWVINPTYFLPLLSDPVGYIIIGIILIYYVMYIIFINKTMKVKI